MEIPKNNNSLEIIVQTKDLIHALNFASSVVEKRNVVTELSHIKLSAQNGELIIGATDLDLYLTQTIGANVIAEGQTTVSTQTLSDIVRKIPDSELRIKQNLGSDQLELIGSFCSFNLMTLPALHFPEMEDVESEVSLSVACAEFARIIEYTSFAMSNEETRYNLNGVFLHVKDGNLCSAATDGHRLSTASTPILQLKDSFGVIVPKKTIIELLKIIRDSKNINSEIAIFLSINKIKFICNKVVLISKLIDGNFPEYEPFIPKDNPYKLVIKTKLLADAIDRVATITVEKFRAIKLFINDKNIEITASGEAKGAAKENLVFSDSKETFCHFDGQDVTIGFNPKYISDVLSVLKEEKVILHLKDAISPALIKNETNADDNFVIMPVKV